MDHKTQPEQVNRQFRMLLLLAKYEPTGSNGRPSAVVSMYVSTKTPVLLQTACVRVKAPDKTTPVIQTRILLDSGSQRSYISSKLCNQLGLKENSKETLLVKTFAAEGSGVQFSRPQRDDKRWTRHVFISAIDSNHLRAANRTADQLCDQYLSGLDLADSSDGKDCLEVGVLIGVDQYWKIVTGNVVKGIAGPTAIETAFGWVLSGPVLGLTFEPTVTCLSTVHMMKVDASVCSAQQEIANLEMRLQAFWDLETLGIKESETSVYGNFMESTPSDIGSMGITHYLPHHAVIKEDKQTSKLRIVYDASARSNGLSLNDCLYAGPTFGQNIMDILLRFRIHRVAVIADIEKAFFMVSVSEEDRDALRFLWIHDINAQLPRLVIMRFARVLFGVSASPFLLNATIRRHVEKYRDEDPLFTEDEALELFTKARLCLDKALRKFVSNSLNLQTRVSPQEHQAQVPGRVSVACEDESYTKNTLGERLDHPEYIKVLGVKWKPMDDTLICDLSNLYQAASELKPTKRNVIGLSARDICVAKLNWDDDLEGDLLKRWKGLILQMREPLLLRIPRCYFKADLPSRGADLSELGTCIPESWLTLPPGLCEPEHETSEIDSCSSEASAMELKIGSRPTSQNTHSLVVQELCQFDSVIRCEDCRFYERLIQSVKRCLRKVIGKAKLSYDELMTTLVEVEATLNSRPISYLSSEDFEEPLKPSHLLIGRRVITLPDVVVTREKDPNFKDTDTRVDLNRRMRYLSLVMVTFWKRWRSEYLTALRERRAYDPGLGKPPSKVAVGDVVLIYDPDRSRTIWRMGKVETLLEGADGAARGASLRVMSGSKSAVLRRPIQHLYPLESAPQVSDTEREPETTTSSSHSMEPVASSRRSNPPRVAAQLAKI
eukprot:Em0004g1610a